MVLRRKEQDDVTVLGEWSGCDGRRKPAGSVDSDAETVLKRVGHGDERADLPVEAVLDAPHQLPGHPGPVGDILLGEARVDPCMAELRTDPCEHFVDQPSHGVTIP